MSHKRTISNGGYHDVGSMPKRSINCASDGALKTQDPFRQWQCQGWEGRRFWKGSNPASGRGGALRFLAFWLVCARPSLRGRDVKWCWWWRGGFAPEVNSLDVKHNPSLKGPRGQMERQTQPCECEIGQGCADCGSMAGGRRWWGWGWGLDPRWVPGLGNSEVNLRRKEVGLE